MHVKFSRSLDEKLVDREKSYWWSKFGDIKGETENTIVATKDQAVSKNCLKKNSDIINWKQTLTI